MMMIKNDVKSSKSHKVIILKILPKHSYSELFQKEKCYLGISIHNDRFSGDYFAVLLDWIAEKFHSCILIIDDYLTSYDQQIFHKKNPDDSKKIAQIDADKYYNCNQRILDNLPDGFKIKKFSEFQNQNTYHKSRKLISYQFEHNNSFRNSIKKTATEYLDRQIKNGKEMLISSEKALQLSNSYLIDELSLFNVLSEEGWEVEIYPGPELHVLKEIALNKHVGMPLGLQNRINVELKVRLKK